MSKIEEALLEKVFAALEDAEQSASATLRANGVQDAPSLAGFFTAKVHQVLYCILCGADPKTFAGGNPKTAIAVIRNSQQIARHYWNADVEPEPRP